MNKDFSYQKIEELVDIGLGFTHTPSYTTSGIPFLSVKNITNGEISFNSTKFISKEEFEKAPNGAKPQKGDVLFGRVGTIGYPHVIETDISFCTFVSLGYMRIKDSNILCNYYLKYWMKSDLFYSQVLSNIQGIAIKNLNTGWLKNFIIPTPPLPIQEQIVKELDTLSDIITKKKEQLAELDKLAQATFYDMFGDPIKNEKNWCIKKIGAFSSVGTGATPNRQKEDIYFGGNIPWVKTTEVCGLEIKKTEECITEQALKDTNCKLFPINTILLAMYGQGKTRGQVGLLKIEATTNQACAAIFPEKEVNNKFLYLYLKLNYQYIRSLGRGGNQENLNLSLVKSIPVIIPPIFLQNQFAKKIEAIEQQKVLINKSITDVQLLFNYTMDKYFN